MGTSRAGRAAPEKPSPLKDAASAEKRLRELWLKMGRSEESAEELCLWVRYFARGYHKGTSIVNDPRFRRFQRALGRALDTLDDFTKKELAQERGHLSPTPKGDSLEQRSMSLGKARDQLSQLHQFFVEQSPLNGPSESWLTEYGLWSQPNARAALQKWDLRMCLSGFISAQVFHARSEPDAEFGPDVTASELMLLALLNRLPGESFDGGRTHYDRTLDAWTKALRRAHRTNRPSKA